MEVEPAVLSFFPPPFCTTMNLSGSFRALYICFSEMLPSQFQSDLFSIKFGDRNFNTISEFDFRSVKGLHLNLVFINVRGLKKVIQVMLGAYVPWLVGFTREDVRRMYPFMQKNVFDILRESGYLHIQATKPDTAGNELSLYCYILYTDCLWYIKKLITEQRLTVFWKQYILMTDRKV